MSYSIWAWLPGFKEWGTIIAYVIIVLEEVYRLCLLILLFIPILSMSLLFGS